MSIEIEHLTRRHQGATLVDNVSLSVSSGELFVLLGPSGSGKSTLLRMIAGLTDVDAGTVRLHGRDVTRVPPKDRGIGFVFQSYGLFRHMSVAENVEFALSVRGIPASQCRERREELLQVVGLAGLGKRYPRQLSGGQQQRVALARALAHKPEILLLDEPFGALDAKIRTELRHALRTIQRELHLTSVFVTHDQEEAFELADRMAVLREGRLLEVGDPQELYLRPRSPFVATFLGAANLLVGESSPQAVRLGAVELPVATEVTLGRTPRRTQVLFRPEDVEVAAQPTGEHPRLGRGTVEQQALVGGFERLRLRLPLIPGVRPVAPMPMFGADHLLVDAVRPRHEALRLPLRVGSEAWVAVRRFHVLAPASLRLLVDCGEGEAAEAAQRLGRELAGRIDGHTSELADKSPLLESGQLAPESYSLGAETEHADEGFDVLVLGHEPEHMGASLEWLTRVRHHLLLTHAPAPVPSRFLVCVTVGEHGKVDVRFAERLAWQLGAAATVLTILPEGAAADDPPPHVRRFLESCQRALSARGVAARTRVRSGEVHAELLAEIQEGAHDLLVLGAPERTQTGRIQTRSGVLQRLIQAPPSCPILIVRR